ncbi:MAG: acyltransferase family protein [Opitutaceae bacterium]
MKPTEYRADIDGMRAIAVIPVVLFHLNAGLSGGFVGVDVFFVISGYLITRILMRDIGSDKTATQIILNFYERRARRILPAFFAVLAITTFFVSKWYFPEGFIAYAKSLIASNLFYSNFQFWSEISYFHPDSDTKPLLHTWSLSVEEQFYVFFPLLLVLMRGFKASILKVVIVLATIASFAASMYTSWHHGSVSFFWSPIRAWELLFGSILAINILTVQSKKWLNDLLGMVGLSMIIVAYFTINQQTPFPGVAALLPTLGTALVIFSGAGSQTKVSKLLSWSPLTFIGKISYSLYLWHWPLITIYKHYTIFPITVTEKLGLLITSIILAVLSWRFVEQPFRNKHRIPAKMVGVLSIAGISCFCLVGFTVIKNDGFETRFSDEVVSIAKSGTKFISELRNDLEEEATQITNEESDYEFALLGDSHAGALKTKLLELLTKHEISFRPHVTGGHPPIIDVKSNRGGKEKWFSKIFNQVLEDPSIDVVYLAAYWSVYVYGPITYDSLEPRFPPNLRDDEGNWFSSNEQFTFFEDNLRKTVDQLIESGKKVVLIGDAPEPAYDIPLTLAFMKYRGLDPSSFKIQGDDYRTRNEAINGLLQNLAKQEHVFFIDLAPPLKGTGDWYIAYKDEQCLFRDINHLSPHGVEEVAPVIEASIVEMLDLFADEHKD